MGVDLGSLAGAASQQEMNITQGLMDWGVNSIQRSWGSKATRHAREFAERVMRNQIQWMVKDLEKAGLNPVLAVSRGGPGIINPGTAAVPNLDAPDVARNAATAKALASAGQERENLKITSEILRDQATEQKAKAAFAVQRQNAEVGRLYQEQALLEEQARKTWAERNESVARTQHLGMQNQLLGISMPGHAYDARIANSAYGKMLKWVSPATDAVGDLTGVVGGFLAGRGFRSRAAAEAGASSAREVAPGSDLSPRAQRALQEMREMGK